MRKSKLSEVIITSESFNLCNSFLSGSINVKNAEMSKESGIAVFSQELGDGVSVYSTAGFGLYGVDVFVEAKNGEQARELIAPEIL